jgi:hypothetical protein
VVEIAAGQQATPYQKTEATLAPIIESAAEGHPLGRGRPSRMKLSIGQQLAGALFSPVAGLNLFLIECTNI